MDETEQGVAAPPRKKGENAKRDSAAASGPAPAPPRRGRNASPQHARSPAWARRGALTSSLTSTIVDVVDERSM